MGSHLGFTLLAFGFVSSLTAAEPGPVVAVRLYNYAGVSERTIGRATEIAGSLFERAGLTLRFLHCEPGAEHHSACPEWTGTGALKIRIARSSRVDRLETLGYSLIPAHGVPAELATVFAEHVRRYSVAHRVPAHVTFAAVFAHEIYHLLAGDAKHSPSGFMCHKLGRRDLVAFGQSAVWLTPDQVRRLHEAYRRRLQPAGAPPVVASNQGAGSAAAAKR